MLSLFIAACDLFTVFFIIISMLPFSSLAIFLFVFHSIAIILPFYCSTWSSKKCVQSIHSQCVYCVHCSFCSLTVSILTKYYYLNNDTENTIKKYGQRENKTKKNRQLNSKNYIKIIIIKLNGYKKWNTPSYQWLLNHKNRWYVSSALKTWTLAWGIWLHEWKRRQQQQQILLFTISHISSNAQTPVANHDVAGIVPFGVVRWCGMP